MKVLVTGASGRIGQAFREYYRDYYFLRLVEHQTPVRASSNEEVVSADITDFQSILKAMKGMEAVVHLAADPRGSAPWDSILKLNIIGTYNVFEAARLSGVKKIVYASSNHACGYAVLESDLVGPDVPIRPDSLYGVSKVFGEALGRYYSDKFGVSVICLRIGACHDPEVLLKRIHSSGGRLFYPPEKYLAMWISRRDVAQLIHKSLEADLKFGIFYGTSNNERKIFDLSSAKEKLGYEPQDRIEDYISTESYKK